MLLKIIAFLTIVTLIGTEASPSLRISNGDPVASGSEAMWLASFQRKAGGNDTTVTHLCDAAILSEEWLVTLATCVLGDLDIRIHQVRTNTKNYQYGGAAINLIKWVIHPEFDAVSRNNNIALIQTLDPIDFDDFTATTVVLAPQNSDPEVGTPMVLYSHGPIREPGTPSSTPMKLSVEISDRLECSNIFPGYITDNNICARSVYAGSGACEGDVGGPLMVGYNVLHGMADHGTGCGDSDYPFIYVRMGMYRKWIAIETGL